MRHEEQISLANIKLDRFPINPTTLALVDYLRSGGEVPPIHVEWRNGSYIVLDGRHRVCAFKLLGRTTILARWGTRDTLAITGRSTRDDLST